MDDPIVPRFGAGALSDVLPAIGAQLGVSGFGDVLGLPAADRYVLLLIDGLGERQLADAPGVAPHLSAGLAAGRTLTSVVPSTTVSAITSLATGLTPGEHGMAGYSFAHPFAGGVLNALAWEHGLSGLDVQPRFTALERLARAGITVSTVLPGRFARTGLTEAALRGGRFVGIADEEDFATRVDQIVDAALAGQRTFVYAYERSLDHLAHAHGTGSALWLDALVRVDAFVAELRRALPTDVRLIVTADHGMVDVGSADRLLIEDEPALSAGVHLMAGEGRLRQLYTRQPSAVARRWAERLGSGAWVRTRDEAVDAGWFGPMSAGMAPRFGDVLVAIRGTGAVLTRTLPGELRLVGMHGSLTAPEMFVPLIVE